MEGIAKMKVRGHEDSTEMCSKTPSNIHYIFNDFWEVVGLNFASKNHQKMHPKSHRKLNVFFIDFWIDFGLILGGKMLPKSDLKIIEILSFFWKGLWIEDVAKRGTQMLLSPPQPAPRGGLPLIVGQTLPGRFSKSRALAAPSFFHTFFGLAF